MSESIEFKRSYSNLEILNLVIVALAKGCPQPSTNPENPLDTIVARSWKALDDTFENGFRQGKERGYQEGYNAAKAEIQAAQDAANEVIEGICRTVWKRVK